MSRAKPSKLKDAVPIPDVLRPSIEKARARTVMRRHGPPVHLERGDDGKLHWSWPFGEDDAERGDWKWLVLDTFGMGAMLSQAITGKINRQRPSLSTGAQATPLRLSWVCSRRMRSICIRAVVIF